MKKRILMLTLVLMIVLSSFSVVFGEVVYYLEPTSIDHQLSTSNLYTFYDKNGISLGTLSANPLIIGDIKLTKYDFWYNYGSVWYSSNWSRSINLDNFPLQLSNEGFVPYTPDTTSAAIDQWGNINDPSYMNPIKTVSIKPAQRILFNYSPENKDLFLKSITATPKKSITLHQGYYINNEVIDLVIKKDTTDLLIGQNALDLSDFPPHRPLNQNEYLGYTQANSGNWIWYPGSNGDPVTTDKNSLVTFVIDQRYCSYKVTSANTGLVIDEGGQMPSIPDDGIYSGPGNITDNYLLDRGDFEEGLIGDIKFGFENLFQFIRMPFELLYKFILTLGDVITYALGTVAGFTTALQGIYAILPGPIWFLVIMAISINVFKLIFGR